MNVDLILCVLMLVFGGGVWYTNSIINCYYYLKSWTHLYISSVRYTAVVYETLCIQGVYAGVWWWCVLTANRDLVCTRYSVFQCIFLHEDKIITIVLKSYMQMPFSSCSLQKQGVLTSVCEIVLRNSLQE
jgi:hypothetical protein